MGTDYTYAHGLIKKRAATFAHGEIVSVVQTAPLLPLLADIGNGTGVVAYCDAPSGWSPSGYNWYFATENDVTKAVKKNEKPTSIRAFMCPGWIEDDVVYAWVAGCDSAGNEGPKSTVAQDATLSKVTGDMVLDGPTGDLIPAGEVFSCALGDHLIAFVTLAEATIP